ncbi:MAG: hypothetical protein EZS28_021693 [Streblomastix strix]|uniref:Reverse transcriptase domain-containing protein n=1 Tax=Streblomastix strix TaxID=222440 RepID=A0A5J4VJJ6_9EUKA|nr:MAG: hypothetical protein EZS28_021693 [Streblomastix strix]
MFFQVLNHHHLKYFQVLNHHHLKSIQAIIHHHLKFIQAIIHHHLKQPIQRGDYSPHLDIEKAYHHVTVSKELQMYFNFHFRGKAYTYVGLPFGWNRSPTVFCRIMKQAVRAIRERWKIRVIQYIDDTILLSQNQDQLKTDTLEIMQFMEQLGWKIQRLKCRTNVQRIFDIKRLAVETQVQQMDRNCQEGRKSEDQGSGICYRRTELRKDVAVGCIIAHEDIEQRKTISNVQEYLERQIQDGWKIIRRLDMMVGESQGEFASVLQEDSIKRIASQQEQITLSQNSVQGIRKVNDTKLKMVNIQRYIYVIVDPLSRIAANGDFNVMQKVLDKALIIPGHTQTVPVSVGVKSPRIFIPQQVTYLKYLGKLEKTKEKQFKQYQVGNDDSGRGGQRRRRWQKQIWVKLMIAWRWAKQ